MKTLHLFAGAGGGLLADLILGHEPIVAVEWDAYACQVLRERAADGWFPNLHVWEGDIRLFNPSEYAGEVDCIHAGFPCTDISVAGNQAGIGKGTRSGLYREILRIADVVQPEYLFLENVAAIVTGNNGEWLRTVIGDLAERGFDACWATLSAAEVGAKHKRDRWWCLAKRMGNPASERFEGMQWEKHEKAGSRLANTSNVADTERMRQQRQRERIKRICEKKGENRKAGNAISMRKHEKRQAKPTMGSVANDVPNIVDGWNDIEAQVGRTTNETQNRADKLKCLGNAQVPLQAAAAFSYLMKVMDSASE